MRPASVTAAAIIVFIQSIIAGLIALVALFIILFINSIQERSGVGPQSADPLLGTVAVILLATALGGFVTGVGLLGGRLWAVTAAVILEGANLPILVLAGLHFDASGAASDPQSFLVFLGIFLLMPVAVVCLLFLPRLGL